MTDERRDETDIDETPSDTEADETPTSTETDGTPTDTETDDPANTDGDGVGVPEHWTYAREQASTATDGGATATDGGQSAEAGQQQSNVLIEGEDAELDRGPFQRWVASSISNPDRAYRAMFYTATIFFLFTTLFPFYWLLMVALTPEGQQQDIILTPNGFNPGAFVEVFQVLPFHWYVFNSFVIATASTIVVLVIASLAGYAFGRLQFPGKIPLMLLVLVISFFPPAAFFIPLNDLFNTQFAALEPITGDGSLYNTPGAMVLPLSAIFMPLAIFILTTFYSQIPDGLEDAARVEGTTRLGALFRVIIPLSAPGVATAGVLTFIAVYNEFFFSFLMTDGQPENWAPILEGILGYQGQYEVMYHLMAAASIIGVIPVAILVIIAQEKIVSGLTAGALKE
ncbi:binding-protein-dependent transport system inner membrane protein [Natrialba hulunbeirensis JCM 10989]|uniref:Binding-protein-dependent transport system inner membrane protein n=1 Tax=Natrialba hulunbeirensis JCM 10989 TaxID=1227493 RepID=L9ZJU6_9EURY|nr:carbohydrate ABC transporter permease [Natrialba hulunbeirensis]ELY86614.1 binding-protein-dependent transport system inner membrane protein [Natrialba hulunbeirensis JCM 10989]